MMMVLRRLLAAAACGAALVVGLSPVVAQAVPTPTPTASASPSATADPDSSDTDLDVSPDVALDNSRIIWVLGGAGVAAIAAAAIVIARR
jgi:hypothetical protein